MHELAIRNQVLFSKCTYNDNNHINSNGLRNNCDYFRKNGSLNTLIRRFALRGPSPEHMAKLSSLDKIMFFRDP